MGGRVLLRHVLMLFSHVLALALQGQYLLLESVHSFKLALLLHLPLFTHPGRLLDLDAQPGNAVLHCLLTRLTALEERQRGQPRDLLVNLVSLEFDLLQRILEVVCLLGSHVDLEVAVGQVLALLAQFLDLLLLLLHRLLGIVEH